MAVTSTYQQQLLDAAKGTYTPTDYSKAAGYADRTLSAQSPASVTSLGDVQGQINKASNTLSTPQYQNANYVGDLTNSIYNTMSPITSQQKTGVNQQYNASARGLEEALANKGLLRGGQYVNQLGSLEQGRNAALSNVDTSALTSALAQAISAGQLGLMEKNQLQGQQQTGASQLASLLGQQTGQQQYAQGYNAEQQQNQFANTLAALAAQAGEGQFGANNALQAGALTGTYGGTPTLASQGQNYSNQLALLQALQNYNLGVGQVTDVLPQFSGYNYGDTLKQLLASLGAA